MSRDNYDMESAESGLHGSLEAAEEFRANRRWDCVVERLEEAIKCAEYLNEYEPFNPEKEYM